MSNRKLQLLQRLGLPIEFPSNFFPRSTEAYRRMLAKGADAPDDFAVAYVLAALATAIGKHVRVLVQATWSVRAHLFISVIGFKGGSKSALGEQVFAPLIKHEEALTAKAAADARCRMTDAYDDEDGDEEDGDYFDDDSGDDGCREAPPVIATDVTGPAVVRLLGLAPRQLLINADELASLFIRNTSGTDRQLFCELADGRRRRQYRASQRSPTEPVEAPHVCLVGCLTPDLLKTAYSARGDDGFLDRFLLLGSGESRRAAWPEDVHDPDLSEAWARLIDRLLKIEAETLDAVDGQLNVTIELEAIERFRNCIDKLNLVADAVRMPESQRGTVNKMKGFLPKLALIRRCIRWAAGEFGAEGRLGEISADDAEAACEAVAFFFGRWLIWRPELSSGLVTDGSELIGLATPPGDDPVLLALEAEAAGAQAGIQLIERLARFLRAHGSKPVSISALATAGPMATVSREELQAACEWLVARGHASWADDTQEAICLVPLPSREPSRRSRSPRVMTIT